MEIVLRGRTCLTETATGHHGSSLSISALQDVSPPAPGRARRRTLRRARLLDGEAAGATRLVHAQDVLLQQTSCPLLAAGPPGSGNTKSNRCLSVKEGAGCGEC